MSNEMKSFLNLLYSLARQYISWYEANIKNIPVSYNIKVER